MIDVNTVKSKYKRNYKSGFWRDDYNSRYIKDEEKEILNKVLGDNQTLWKLAKEGIDMDSIKEESIESKFENDTPGYVGRFSGDVIALYRGQVRIGYPSKVYYCDYTKRFDSAGFW